MVTFRRQVSWMLVLVAAALVSGGCFTTSPRMHGIADAFEEDMPGLEFEHQFGMTLGRMSLGMVKGIAKWGMDDDDRDAFAALRGVKKVELATFEAYGDDDFEFPRTFERSLARKGWSTLAKFRDHGELGWVVYRMDEERLKNVMVVVLDHGELTLIRLGGRLDKVVSAALEFSRDEVLSEDYSPLVSDKDDLGL